MEILGNNAVSNIEKARFFTNFVVVEKLLNFVGLRNRNLNRSRNHGSTTLFIRTVTVWMTIYCVPIRIHAF
jgi:hypothetical protein